MLTGLVLLGLSCNIPVASPPQDNRIQAGGDVSARQEQALVKIADRVESVIEIATTMAADLQATVEVVGQKAGRDAKINMPIGLIAVSNQDVTSQIPAAMLAVLAGWLEMKRRQAKKMTARHEAHALSLGKAIRAVHNQFPHDNPALQSLRDAIKEITDAKHDGTFVENERMVVNFQSRNKAK